MAPQLSIKVMNYQAMDREAMYLAWPEAKRQYIEQQPLVLKEEQLQETANMCHYNGEALMRAVGARQLRVLREGCKQALGRRRPNWRLDVRLEAPGILLLGLAVAYTAWMLSRRCNVWRRSRPVLRSLVYLRRKSRPVFRTLGSLQRKSRRTFRTLRTLCRHGSCRGWYSPEMSMTISRVVRKMPSRV